MLHATQDSLLSTARCISSVCAKAGCVMASLAAWHAAAVDMPAPAAGHHSGGEHLSPPAMSTSTCVSAMSGLLSCDSLAQCTFLAAGSHSKGFVAADEGPTQQEHAQPAKRQRRQAPRPALPRTRQSAARKQGVSATGSDSEDLPLRHRSSLRKQPGRAASTPNAGRLQQARKQRLHKLHHTAAGPADGQSGGSGPAKAANLQRGPTEGSSSDELPAALPRSQARKKHCPQVVPDEEGAPSAPQHRTQCQSVQAAAATSAVPKAVSDNDSEGRAVQRSLRAGAVSSSGSEAKSDAVVAPRRQTKRQLVQATVASTSGSDDERLQPAQPRSAARLRAQVVADDDQSDADPPHVAEAAAGQRSFVSIMPVAPEPPAQ